MKFVFASYVVFVHFDIVVLTLQINYQALRRGWVELTRKSDR